MKSEKLAYLAGTADLARLEFALPRLTLHTLDDKLMAQYAGAYSSGCRWIERDSATPEINVDVDSAQFRHFAGTFAANTDIRISCTSSSLQLRSKTANHQLRTYPASERLALPEDIEPLATCDVSALTAEVDLGTELNDSNKGSKGPVGLSITLNKERQYLRLMSFNGVSALLVAQIECDDVQRDQNIVVPAKDFARGLNLFDGGVIELGLSGGRVTLRNDRAWFTSPTENVTWPNLAAMLKRQTYQTVTFKNEQVKAAATSAKVLGASDALELSGTDRGVVLRTLDAEAGSFATAIEEHLDGTFYFGIEDLLFATKACGNEIPFELCPSKPCMIRVGKRLIILTAKAI